MACLTNYTVQCTDVTTGKTGCFLFDTAHWQQTGEFRAVSPVFANLTQFYAWDNENKNLRAPCYLERNSDQEAAHD
ncbi:hypothetical protein [Variovorax sp. 278MFTsu5.1]|uniref:hypothetical protein n=1 Tax=Variovorax sp. 278MFTsu5.1 TaxID=3158366 RepID=UPI003AAC2438